MIKLVFRFIKRVVCYIFILYGFNLIMAPSGFIIPINYFTVFVLSILGIPALFGLILILVLL